ncbi:hypothetical protein [Marinobacter mangrovi]|uniref:hypothetical protein n=1 Tax=Marinobacter mangrovi TaxID=2803918 RepID=UPI0019342950|nr:hypothetical protein [Marinobacter mangrovi]
MDNWKENLTDLFKATVIQQTLEEAAELMVDVSEDDSNYHQHCVDTLKESIEQAKNKNEFVISAINTSGYKVSSFAQAEELLNNFLVIYLKEYGRDHS